MEESRTTAQRWSENDSLMDTTVWPAVWAARWIWLGKPPAQLAVLSDSAAPPDTWNRFVYFRRAFNIYGVPPSPPRRGTADSRFLLYFNCVEGARGPARSVPKRLAWKGGGL